MEMESIVYGCITDQVHDTRNEKTRLRRQSNREALLALPESKDWDLISQDMFAMPMDKAQSSGFLTDIVHFGAAYHAIEYEWQQWIADFEAILKKMYWVTAIVHLQTELSGSHTFTWESVQTYHEPHEVNEELAVRCEWSREGAFA